MKDFILFCGKEALDLGMITQNNHLSYEIFEDHVEECDRCQIFIRQLRKILQHRI